MVFGCRGLIEKRGADIFAAGIEGGIILIAFFLSALTGSGEVGVGILFMAHVHVIVPLGMLIIMCSQGVESAGFLPAGFRLREEELFLIMLPFAVQINVHAFRRLFLRSDAMRRHRPLSTSEACRYRRSVHISSKKLLDGEITERSRPRR